VEETQTETDGEIDREPDRDTNRDTGSGRQPEIQAEADRQRCQEID